MELSDRELVSRMRAGDEAALAAFFERHAGRVFGLLVKMVRRREDAEDLLQTTFCEAWRRADRFDPTRSRVESWLLLIARSRALDYLRTRRPLTEIEDEDEPTLLSTPENDLERLETNERLDGALMQLPPEQRCVIEHAFFAGLTHEQIANQLSLPLGTIKTRIRLGMNRLRILLRER
jgi:RNA polymerase sigma-70 factor (ECF subfamily)